MSDFTQTLFGLTGRVAIVSGASRGIGAAIANALAAAGATVYGLGRSETPDSAGPDIHYRRCDIRDNSAFNDLCTEASTSTGCLDILVNAAGITLPQQVQDDPAQAFRETLAVNVSAIYDSCLSAQAFMPDRGGSIINITSIGAQLGFPGNPGYVAAKGGVAAMSRALALDLGARKIRVNNLVPGYIHTAMTDASYTDHQRREDRASRTMLGRWGKPDDLIGAALFLASDASRYVTGSDITVDGGWTAKGL